MKSIVMRGMAVWVLSFCGAVRGADEEGFMPLFNGKDLSGWQAHGGCEHWKVTEGVIDYDGKCTSENPNLVSEKTYQDFVLKVDWRLPGVEETHMKPLPAIRRNGTVRYGPYRRPLVISVNYAGEGDIGLRGDKKAAVHIWNHPIGSGIIEAYRKDESLPMEARGSVTPSKAADKTVGEWNTFVITMKGDRVTVELNGEVVVDQAALAGVATSGPIMLMHAGDLEHPRRAQYRNVMIKALK